MCEELQDNMWRFEQELRRHQTAFGQSWIDWIKANVCDVRTHMLGSYYTHVRIKREQHCGYSPNILGFEFHIVQMKLGSIVELTHLTHLVH